MSIRQSSRLDSKRKWSSISSTRNKCISNYNNSKDLPILNLPSLSACYKLIDDTAVGNNEEIESTQLCDDINDTATLMAKLSTEGNNSTYRATPAAPPFTREPAVREISSVRRKYEEDINSSYNLIKKSKTTSKQSLVNKLQNVTEKLEETAHQLLICQDRIKELEKRLEHPAQALIDLSAVPIHDWSQYYIN